MLRGHGDDAYLFGRAIRSDFSSNVYSHMDLEPLKAHLRAHLDVIGHYPEPEPYRLEKALAERLGIAPSTVCVTAGATEAIYHIAHAFSGRHSTILAPTFSEYADACRMYQHSIAHSVAPVSVLLPKKGRFAGHRPPLHSLLNECGNDGYLGSEPCVGLVEQPVFLFCEGSQQKRVPVAPGEKASVIWLCNPNNPTGSVIPKEQMIQAIEENPDTIFVMDQSYGFFTKEELLTPAEAVRYPNALQLHSMTKRYAMPGLRLGYVTGHPALIEQVRAVRMPWSVNALAIEAGLFLCAHPDTAPIDLPALLAETQRLVEALNDIPGLTAEPTQTHFFLCSLSKGSAADLKRWLADRHSILIRDASNFQGLDDGCFRIATQTREENDRLVHAIRQYLEDGR